MTAPDTDTLGTYGGATQDAAPVSNPQTDRPASAVNQEYATTAMQSHTAIKAWVRFTPVGTAAPVLAASGAQHDEQWGTAMGPTNALPVVARPSTTGIYTLTWPATVQDEIPSGSPGASAGHALNLRVAWCNEEIASGTLYKANAVVTAPNVVTVYIWSVGASPALADPSGPTFAVFAI